MLMVGTGGSIVTAADEKEPGLVTLETRGPGYKKQKTCQNGSVGPEKDGGCHLRYVG